LHSMDRKEILRYLRTNSKTEDPAVLALVDEAAAAVEKAAVPKTLYRVFPCEADENGVTIGGWRFESKRLAQTVKGCPQAAVFGATLGIGVDRLIQQASATEMALAVALQAAAAAEIEEVCDELEEQIRREHGVSLRQRYSPGYFDLDITAQRSLFQMIEITKRIGITLTDSCEMAPSKSVTAIIGIEDSV